jgi:SAM-dependent methyltransferase
VGIDSPIGGLQIRHLYCQSICPGGFELQQQVSIEKFRDEILLNNQRLSAKPLLRRIYREFHIQIAQRLSRGEGLTVEIGAGTVGLKSVVPDCISTDLFPTAGIDIMENAYELSFKNESLQNLVLFDVFHHLEYPGSALAEFRRVLKADGRLIIFEPYASLTGWICYGLLHKEPLGFLKSISWIAPEGRAPSEFMYYAAQGNATRIFRSKKYLEKLKAWRIREMKVFTSLSYVASGGFSGPQLYPEICYPLLVQLDRLASLAPALFGTRLLVVLEPGRLSK